MMALRQLNIYTIRRYVTLPSQPPLGHHHHDHQEICHTLGSLLGASLEAQCNALMEAQVLVIIIIIHIIIINIINIIILLSDLVHNVIFQLPGIIDQIVMEDIYPQQVI